jgi:hypothetical protein
MFVFLELFNVLLVHQIVLVKLVAQTDVADLVDHVYLLITVIHQDNVNLLALVVQLNLVVLNLV